MCLGATETIIPLAVQQANPIKKGMRTLLYILVALAGGLRKGMLFLAGVV